MKSYLYALKFILCSRTGRFDDIIVTPMEIKIRGNTIQARRFERGHGDPRGTVLAVGGMSVYGIEDRRFHSCCMAMASCGFRVVFTCFRDIDRFKIRAETVKHISDALQRLAGDPGICPDGKISLFAPSFSAGLCLLAAAGQKNHGIIKSICTIGTFGSVATSIEFLLKKQDNDEYGRMIILYNFIRSSLGGNGRAQARRARALEKALKTAFMDNGFQREKPELPSLLGDLAPVERDIFNRLRDDPSYRMLHWERIRKNNTGMGKMMNELCVFSKLGSLKAPVVLIHGSHDEVIPPSESVLLHQGLKRLKRITRLVLTPLISHGDAELKLALLPQALRLAGGFAFFFKHAARKA